MRKKMLLVTLLSTAGIFINLSAQQLPLVYTAENTGATYPVPYLPTLTQLPVIPSLPDPFEWADGRGRIAHFSDWEYRRTEISAQIQNYEIGVKPPRPDSITASYSAGTLTVNVFVSGKTLTLTSQVILPTGTGPFPAVIGMNSPSGSTPSTIFSSRNVAQIAFMHNQVTTYGSPSTTDPYYMLYPSLNPTNTGQYSAWIWGVSRIIDGLELVQNSLPIDLKHIAVTGCSYAGKMALFAGAFDERVALTIAQESGGGGATSWRYTYANTTASGSDQEEGIGNTDYNWFMNSMSQFAGSNVYLMPEDHHELMAMVAPRALYVTANPSYIHLSNPSCDVCSRACAQVYSALGIPDRFNWSIVGNHTHCAVPDTQVTEIGKLVDKFLLGKDSVVANYADSPYSIDLSPWITWTAPTLTSGNSYHGRASLVFPANLQKGLDTSVTLKWNKATDSNQYLFQLATDAAFINVVATDSTTDTVKTVSGLSNGGLYYWHIRGKDVSGSIGPWSDVWSFSTYVSLPNVPQLLTPAFLHPGQTDSTILIWRKAQYASQYNIQIS
ncbi:MAG TPA: hypothetical protein VMU30_13030, partial [Bacteroidota bacterium]|nr:hypothetical protein [Bacteroidota bacterium]